MEIISGSTGRLDLGPKKAVSAREGVVEYWAIFPVEQQVEIYLLQADSEQPARTVRADETLETPILPGLKTSLAKIFAP